MTAAATAAYRLWQAQERLAEKRAALAAWAVPAPTLPAGYVDASASLAGDGLTDDTAALAALVAATAAGSTLFFPAGTYRIDGPISFPPTKPLALVGEAGTIIDCSHCCDGIPVVDDQPLYVILIGDGATAEALPLTRYAGFSISGIRFVGPGMETRPEILWIRSLDGFTISRCRFESTGTMAIALLRTLDCTIEDCVFVDNYREGLGYCIVPSTACDNTVIRRNFFVSKHRAAISPGSSFGGEWGTGSNPDLWGGAITIHDNYSQGATAQTFGCHPAWKGPYICTNNVAEECLALVGLRGCAEGITIDNNVIADCQSGIWVNDYCTTYVGDPCEETRALDDCRNENPPAITNNVIDTCAQYPFRTRFVSATIADNVIRYGGWGGAPVISMGTSLPTTYVVTGNIYVDYVVPAFDLLLNADHNATEVSGNVCLGADVLPAGPAAFTAFPTVAVTGEAVVFTDATPGSPPDWEWDFGDGSGSAAQHPTHVYPAPGVYPVTLAADTTTAAQTITVVPGVSYGGARLSEADLAPLDHDPVANATDLHNGRVGLQGSPVSRKAWTINGLADDHAEIEALAALTGQHATLNINGTEYPGVMIRPPLLETQLTPSAWAYQIGFVQETRR